MSNKSILIIDDDSTVLKLLEIALTKQGFSVKTAHSALEAAELTEKTSFSLIISDINMPEITGVDFLLWLKKYKPNIQIIFLLESESTEMLDFANKNGVLKCFIKPLDIKTLTNFVIKFLGKGFSGNIREINLVDFIQIITLSGNNKLFEIHVPNDNTSGKLYFNEGNLIHAEFDNSTGKDAFHKILKLKSGIFSDTPWTDPQDASINIPVSFLIMDTLRIID